MTPLATLYLIVGLVSFVWPLTLLLMKRTVMGVQWLMMVSLLLFGLSAILYSTFFNTFLYGEYLLVLLYMILSLFVLSVTQASVALFTHVSGKKIISPILLVPSLLTVALMALSVVVGGADMYRLWIARGALGDAGLFYANSWRYNVIVAVHYYLYWIVLIFETTYVFFYVIHNLRRFHLVLNEYYTAQQQNLHNIRGIFITVGINCLCVFVNYLLFPFNRPRPIWAAAVICSVQSVDILALGWLFYKLNFSAERIGEKLRNNKYGRGNLQELGRQITNYVEHEHAYLNPDLSVFLLSERFKVSQDDVVDAIHQMNGAPFSDYIDGLRVEHATSILMEQPDFDYSDNEHLSQLAHACGYLREEDLQRAFASVMQTSLQEWSRN